MTNAVELIKVSHRFGDKRVLNDVSISVEQGKIFGLIGPSGAGKTTIVRILTGQLAPTGGNALLIGKDSQRLNGSDLKRIGIMMDNFGLYERLSVQDNLKIFADIHRIHKGRVTELLKETGLYDSRKKAASSLSKGMGARLRLARALVNNAEVLFLDEPTSGLDPMTAGEIRKMLLRERDSGKTIFLTTHNMAEAESICDCIALLNNGDIAEMGDPKEICRRYNHLNRLEITLREGGSLSLPHSPESAQRVGELMSEDMIEAIHSTEPNLESVFIELTGRGLGGDE